LHPSPELTAVTREAALNLLAYCRARDWAGYDPYDALNSRLFKALPLLDFKLARLLLTQLNKRSPFNLRRILLVSPTQNPKGLALFLDALLKLSGLGVAGDESELLGLAEDIARLRSPGTRYWSWGYSFPWQTRTVLVPRGSPNLVCTCFVGNALLDLFDSLQRERHLEMAVSAAEYLADELFFAEGPAVASFHYPLAGDRAKVHNANLLAAAFLRRVSNVAGESRFVELAHRAATYSVGRQQADGSWWYGESPTQRWIDNFHTGFNLCALNDLEKHGGTREFHGALERGLNFYAGHFFEADGAPKYFHDRTFPLDIHSAAQSVITLFSLSHLDFRCAGLARKVLAWTLQNMRDADGHFYYRKYPLWTNRISFARWGQAWMLLALAVAVESLAGNEITQEPCAAHKS
jgi:hypothetical protein